MPAAGSTDFAAAAHDFAPDRPRRRPSGKGAKPPAALRARATPLPSDRTSMELN
jgi:hypothetical protein